MNKHRYTLLDGSTPVPGSKPTGWAFSDAVIQRKCPKCGCDAGFYCETPKGRKQWPPHNARIVVGPEHRVRAYKVEHSL